MAEQLSVYHLERTELAVGDTIRITRNDPALDLTNGDRMRVASVIGGLVRLESVERKDDRPSRLLDLVASKPGFTAREGIRPQPAQDRLFFTEVQRHAIRPKSGHAASSSCLHAASRPQSSARGCN